MQRWLSISAEFLAVILLISSTGLVVNSHICMGKVKNAALFASADKCFSYADDHSVKSCSNLAHGNEKPCCEDESTFLSEDDEKQIQPASPLKISWTYLYTISYPTYVLGQYPAQVYHIYDDSDPPPLPSRDRLSRFSIFRI